MPKLKHRLLGSLMRSLLLGLAVAANAQARDCELHLLHEARAAPFTGLRAVAAHAMLVHWEGRKAHSSWAFLRYGRSAGDEVVTSRALLEPVAFPTEHAQIESLLTLNASPAAYAAWRDCQLRQPGLKLALKQLDGQRAVVELIWALPSGHAVGLPLRTTLQSGWVNAQAASGEAFPGLTVNGSFHWEAVLQATAPAQDLVLTVAVGEHVAQLQVPALNISPQVQFPRLREAWSQAPANNAWIEPVANPRVPGEFLWLTNTGCLVAEQTARRHPNGRKPYRYTWSGGCQDGWLQGQGTLAKHSTTAGVHALLEGRFERGELIDGTHWYVVAGAAQGDATPFYRVQVRGGANTQGSSMAMHAVPAALAQSLQARLASQARQAEAAQAANAAAQDDNAWFTPAEKKAMAEFFGALVQGLGTVAEIKGAQRLSQQTKQAYEAHNKSGSRDYEGGARLLQKKLDAERNLKALQTEAANRNQTARLEAGFAQANKVKGEEAPLGVDCLQPFEDERRDPSVLREHRSRHMVNACRNVTIGVFNCRYQDGGGESMHGTCESAPNEGIKPRQRFRLDHGHADAARNEVIKAFCALGSHPTDFRAAKDTRATGIGWYRCVWD